MHLADMALFDKTFGLNVKPIFLSAQALVPYWLEQKFDDPPVMINICSTGAIRPRPGIAFYNSSKGAVLVATKCVAIEYAPHIRCVAIAPALAPTAMLILLDAMKAQQVS